MTFSGKGLWDGITLSPGSMLGLLNPILLNAILSNILKSREHSS